MRNSPHNQKSYKPKSNKETHTSKSNPKSKSMLLRLKEKKPKSRKLWPFGNKKELWLPKIVNKFKADLTKTKNKGHLRQECKKWTSRRKKRAPNRQN